MSEAYKLWHQHLQHVPRLSRFSLGLKIDSLYTTLIETLVRASYANKEKKEVLIDHASATLDTLKFFLILSWEMKLIDHRKFETLSVPLNEVGKMIGGWKKFLVT